MDIERIKNQITEVLSEDDIDRFKKISLAVVDALFQDGYDAGYQVGYAAGVESLTPQTTEALDIAAETEAETIQADQTEVSPPVAVDPAGSVPQDVEPAIDTAADSPETQQVNSDFDPLSYKHAQNCTPQTVCGIPIDHKIDAVHQDDAGLVTCPRCKEVMAASNNIPVVGA